MLFESPSSSESSCPSLSGDLGLTHFFISTQESDFHHTDRRNIRIPTEWLSNKIITSKQGFIMRTKRNRKDAQTVAIVLWTYIFLHPHWESSKKTHCMFSVKAGRSFLSWEKRAQCGYLNTPPIIVEWHFCQIHIRHLWGSLLQQLRGKITSTWIYHIVLVKLSSHIY